MSSVSFFTPVRTVRAPGTPIWWLSLQLSHSAVQLKVNMDTMNRWCFCSKPDFIWIQKCTITCWMAQCVSQMGNLVICLDLWQIHNSSVKFLGTGHWATEHRSCCLSENDEQFWANNMKTGFYQVVSNEAFTLANPSMMAACSWMVFCRSWINLSCWPILRSWFMVLKWTNSYRSWKESMCDILWGQ